MNFERNIFNKFTFICPSEIIIRSGYSGLRGWINFSCCQARSGPGRGVNHTLGMEFDWF